MNDSSLESQFLAAMTHLARKVLHPNAGRTYDIVLQGAEQFIDQFADCSHGGGAYVLWMDISDLYADPRGPLSADLCEEVGRKVAAEWLSVDPSSPDAISTFFARWRTVGEWQARSR